MANEDTFIDVEITTDEATLADGAVDRLQTAWPDWEPNDGDLEVVILEAVASMFADAAVTASQMPARAFQAFGQMIAGVSFNSGLYATATLIFTLADTTGQTIPAGTEVDVDGYVFATDQDVASAPGDGTITATATATELGAAFNGLTGAVVTPISSLARVASVALSGVTANGADEETVPEYLDRLVLEMQLRGITLVTLRDFELMTLTHASVARVVAEHLGARAVRVTAVDAAGAALSAGVKTELQALYAQYAMVNITYTMNDPAFRAVNVTYTVKAYPGNDPVALKAEIDAEIAAMLNPLSWGQPKEFGDVLSSRWYNEPRVRVNKLVDLIGNVLGVDYVTSLTLSTAPVAGVTGVAATDLLTLNNHGFVADQRVVLSSLAGGAGLSNGTVYFVKSPTTNTFQLAATAGGAAINFTTDITAATAIAPSPETNGDLILPGAVPLPTPGTLTGTIT